MYRVNPLDQQQQEKQQTKVNSEVIQVKLEYPQPQTPPQRVLTSQSHEMDNQMNNQASHQQQQQLQQQQHQMQQQHQPRLGQPNIDTGATTNNASGNINNNNNSNGSLDANHHQQTPSASSVSIAGARMIVDEATDPTSDNTNNQTNNHQQQANMSEGGDTSRFNAGANTSMQSGSNPLDISCGHKTPNSYKYPLLKKYFEFGPWVGRNRKALCVHCRTQASSSQPDRLLKHLNKCSGLSEEDKAVVAELMNERTANKRRRRGECRLSRETQSDSDSPFYPLDDQQLADDLTGVANSSHDSLPLPLNKKQKRDNALDKNSQIDEALVRFIIHCRIPLKAIHSPSFIEFCRALNADYVLPSRERITNVLIPGLLNII